MKTGVELIADERSRQINEEGWMPDHDDRHVLGELAKAAACYAIPHNTESFPFWIWPWSLQWWKPTPNDRIRELSKAGALIAAEIDRLQRGQVNCES